MKPTIIQLIKKKIYESKLEKIRPKGQPQYSTFKTIRKIKGDVSLFEDYLVSSDSTIGIVLGARGKGKSALGLRCLENLAYGVEGKLFAIGFKERALPKWINQIDDIEQVENNSTLLIDESGVKFDSRNSMSNINKLFSKVLLISRHRNLSVILVSQNCLPINQKILTPNGVKELSKLKKEDVIYAFDFDKNRIEPVIAKKSKTIKKKITKIYLEDGRVLKSSEDHKWVVYNKNGLTERKAKDLNIDNDYLVDVSCK